MTIATLLANTLRAAELQDAPSAVAGRPGWSRLQPQLHDRDLGPASAGVSDALPDPAPVQAPQVPGLRRA